MEDGYGVDFAIACGLAGFGDPVFDAVVDKDVATAGLYIQLS